LHPVSDIYELNSLIREEDISRVYSALPYDLHEADFTDVKLIYTIHGLRPIELPTDIYEYKYRPGLSGKLKYIAKQALRPWYVSRQLERYKQLLSASARKRTIVVPSQHTKYSLLSTFPNVEQNEVKVLYSPNVSQGRGFDDFAFKHLGTIESEKFLLLVSAGRWIKNSYRAVKAVDELFSEFADLPHKVVAVGANSEQPKWKMDNPDRFIFLDYVERPVLEALYDEAIALLYPTLNEGFGYPPLEAMRYGTPVLCSAVTSLTEVCGQSALYFNPYSTKEIKGRILRLLFDSALQEELKLASRDRFAKISALQDEMLAELCNLILNG